MGTKRLGFMMRDLLILIAMIAIAVPFSLPPVQKVRDCSAITQHINNLKQMALATHNVNDVYKRLPPATGTFGDIKGGNRSLSVHLLPYIEQSWLYGQLQKYESEPNVVIPPYTAPLDFTTCDFVRVQNFAANVRVFTDLGTNTPFDADVVGITPSGQEGWNDARIPHTFKDGTSSVIMFATRYANNGEGHGFVNCSAYDAWVGKDNSAFFGVSTLASAPTALSTGGWQAAPTLVQANCRFGVVAHSFRKGIQVALGDASVRTLSPSVSPFTWNAAMQPNDGNKLGSDW